MSSRSRGGTYWQAGRSSWSRLNSLRAPREGVAEMQAAAARMQQAAAEAVARMLEAGARAEEETNDAARHDLREEDAR